MNFDDPGYLDRSNPRLLFLELEYKKHWMNRISMWQTWADTIDIKNFRGDPYYLGQLCFGMTEKGYYEAYDYVKQIDKLGLLNKLIEDKEYGIVNFEIEGKIITRDLLDSIIEINFLEKKLAISKKQQFKILDIGAGYGRFAHRIVNSLDVEVICVDCVPISTFLCEYYLYKKSVLQKAKTIILPEINKIKPGEFDLVVNIHSWPECPLESIRKWLALINFLEIPLIFVVGHDIPLKSFEREYKGFHTGFNFYDEIIKNGFIEKTFSYKIGNDKEWFNKGFVGFTPYYIFERE